MIVVNQSSMTKLLAGLAVLAGLVVILTSKVTMNVDSETISNTEVAKPVSGFSLVDHNENKITAETFVGHWTFVFFGFTNCPDVCPATLSQLVQVNKLISKKQHMAGKFRTLFVSVDPDRDGTKHIKEYVEYFDPSFIGATGEMKNIIAFEQQFGAFHIIRDKSNENYTVGHTASVFLVNPDGVMTAKFSPPMDVSMVMQQIDMFVERYAKI